jgi:hypothetical protein
MIEIVGDYKNWQGEQKFPTKSSFTLKGFEFEFKKWDIEKENNPIDKLMFNVWMVEPSPYHPAVMGKIEVYDGISAVYVNPFFEGDEKERIINELKKAAARHFLGK